MKRSEDRREVAEEVLEILLERDIKREDVHDLKTEIASQHSSEIPSNEEILEIADEDERDKVERKLRRRPSRSKSGVSIVAVMSSPEKCPHGTCVPCPKGEEVPQSYVDDEPAVMRAKQNEFDSFEQTKKRLEQLRLTGHPTSKIDLIVMGGTFPARDFNYQKEFLKGCYDALNGRKSADFQSSKENNERADNRCIGLTLETRPDFCKEADINRMLDLGTTRVEVGVQIPDDNVYRKIGRKHTVKDVVESTKLLKDSGLKVTYHYMPGLPGSNPQKDLDYFRKIFSDGRYMPDSLKIYPTLVVEDSELEEWYENGEYQPYGDEELVDLLCDMKDEIPPWARVMRLNRDIPSDPIVAGCKKSNLRQIVQKELGNREKECRCIRCREIGRNNIDVSDANFELKQREYQASGGREYFLSYEDLERDVIAGLLRFRIPDVPFRNEISRNTGIVREVHVYGSEIPIDGQEDGVQHSGFGRKLLGRAENIAMERGMKDMIVMSGIGAREYYRKFGYSLKGPYMYKNLGEQL